MVILEIWFAQLIIFTIIQVLSISINNKPTFSVYEYVLSILLPIIGPFILLLLKTKELKG